VIIQLSTADLTLAEQAVRQFKGAEGDPAFVKAPGVLAFVAIEGDEIVGWCWGYHLDRPDATSMLYVHGLEVVEARRRQGIGRDLLQAFMEAGRQAGSSMMFLFTSEANTPARALYESLGGGLAEHGPTVNYWFLLDPR
jgi:ribosomal protein S18 acetylase RimI-like enzyme